MGKEYTKYRDSGDIHWQWYADMSHNYHSLVNESLVPFSNVVKGDILDVGSGDGLPASLLIDMGFKVFGVDPDTTGNEIAEQKMVEKYSGRSLFEVFEMSIEDFVNDIPCEYDYVYSLNTIEHTDDPVVYRQLVEQANNFAVIVTDNAELRNEIGRFHTKEFTYNELEELFNGFVIERIPISNENFIGIKVRK